MKLIIIMSLLVSTVASAGVKKNDNVQFNSKASSDIASVVNSMNKVERESDEKQEQNIKRMCFKIDKSLISFGELLKNNQSLLPNVEKMAFENLSLTTDTYEAIFKELEFLHSTYCE